MLDNIILITDSYKTSHWKMYPSGMTNMYSYFESRGGEFDRVVFFGLQYYIKRYLTKQITLKDLEKAKRIINRHMQREICNEEGWKYIIKEHDGLLPLVIKSVPEGSIVPTSNVLITVENIDQKCAWLTNYIETLLSQVWYPCTVATQSYYMKQTILDYLRYNGSPELIDFKLHDFGYRGVTCPEQAAIGGAAHLLNFKGTDTLAGIELLEEYYHCDEMPGFSIPASEHSTITVWGRENENKAIANILEQFPDGLVACVSDSYNIYECCQEIYGTQLRDKILERGGSIVVRPDCYDDKTEILTQDGWKLFKDLSSNDDVAQYDNGNISFVKPLRYIEENYSGDMIHFFNDFSGIDLIVTPNHRCVYRQKDNLTIKEAKDIKFFYGKEYLMAGKSIGNITNLTHLDRLKIAFQADGCYESGNNDGHFGKMTNKLTLRFNFSKKRKIDRLIKLCEDGGFDYTKSIESSRPQNTQIYVRVPFKVEKTFEWVLENLRHYNHTWCEEFIEELSHWDSNIRNENRIKYDSCESINAEIVQIISTLAGYKTKYSTYIDNRQPHYKDTNTIHIRKQDFIDAQNVEKNIIQYTGKIYCVTVPSGIVVVRRNNRISISGNSGDPNEVLPSILKILGDKFGFYMKKGYKVLNDKVRIIQGDGIDRHSLNGILYCLKSHGWSADNIAFGSGGGLLQKLNRDTCKFAFKCSSAIVDGEQRDVYKEPITDPGKNSKRGRLSLIQKDGKYQTVVGPHDDDLLKTVFHNGYCIEDSFENIRERVV